MTHEAAPWDEILQAYEQGTAGSRELARVYGVAESTIRKRAKDAGITPDQRRARVAERVQQQVDRAAAPSARDVEDILVAKGIEIVMLHRGLIKRGIDGVQRLLGELAEVSEHKAAVERALTVLIGPTGDGEADAERKAAAGLLVEVVGDAVDLGARAKAAQALSGALKNLVGLQRQAYSLPANVTPEGTPSADSTLRELLDSIDGADTGFR